jgi:HAD superfamily hydrolase (TIGR01509 family)
MIEALLFDLGKVLVDFDFELGMRRFAARTPLSREEFETVIWDKHWIRRYERGEISTSDYHQHLCERGKLTMAIEEFEAAWTSVFLPELIVPLRLLENLRSRYPLILVSNTNEVHATFVAKQYTVLEYFHHRIFSHEVGSLKPDYGIYQAAIKASGKRPEALFFADDREENIEAALELGIRAHLFRSVSGLVDALGEQGVDVGDFEL